MLTQGAKPIDNAGASQRPEFDLPDIIADHRLIRCIGQGSYGKVFLVQNELTETYRALKIVFRDAFRDAKPYLREFDAIRSFEPISRSHPGFVQILHVGKLENAFYYIMELGDDTTSGPAIDPDRYEPRTLGLSRGKMLPIEQCIEIGSSLADCLTVLHEKNLIHRDIKPSNIIFVDGHPKLADIGLVTQIEEAKSFVGTAGFMPPEGPVGPSSDIYSLGKVLYEIATGKDRCEFPELPSDITREKTLHLELNQILLRACHSKPEKRYRSAKELRRELDLLHAGRSIKRLRQVEKRLRMVRFAFGASALIVIAGFLIHARIEAKRQQEERERQRLAGYLLAEGTSEMREGHLSRALPLFLQAAEYDPRDIRAHQLRIGSVLAQVPTLEKRWGSGARAEFSEDGLWLIAPLSNSVQVLESLTGRVIETQRFESPVRLAKISPNRSHLGIATGKRITVLRRSDGDRISFEFEDAVKDFAFSPRDGRVAVALETRQGFFFDPKTRTAQLLPGDASVGAISFDPFGKVMLTSSINKNEADFRDGASGEIIGDALRTSMPYSGAFSPDGQTVIVSGWGSAIPFHVPAGGLAGDTMDNDDAITHSAFSPKGDLLATASYDGTVRLWEVPSFNPVAINHILEHRSRPSRVAFIDANTLVSHCTDGENYVWRIGAGKPSPVAIPREPQVDPLRIDRENVQLHALGNVISGVIANRPIKIDFPAKVSALDVNPQKSAFAAGAKDDEFEITHARLYHLDDLKHPVSLEHIDGINFITFSHSGERVVTCSEDFSAILWDVKTGIKIGKSMRHRWQVVWASFSEDDKWLATVGWDDMCIVWDAQTGEPLTIPAKFADKLESVKFGSGYDNVIVCGERSTYRLDLPFAALPLTQYTNRVSLPKTTPPEPL